MSDVDLPELDTTARALLSAGGGMIDPPLGAQDRVASRLAASIAALGPGGGGGGGGGATASTGGVASKAAGALPRVPLWIVGAAFVAGGAIGFGLHGAVAARDGAASTTVVTIAKTVESPAPSTSTPPASSAPIAIASVPGISLSSLPLVPGDSSASASRFNRAADLSEERKILDDARAAFGRGDPEGAIAKARAHEKRFPHGALSEEREALWVQALAQAGKTDEARARAQKFAQNYPDSMLLPSVNAAAAAQPSRKVAP